jgi:hypothetical protein
MGVAVVKRFPAHLPTTLPTRSLLHGIATADASTHRKLIRGCNIQLEVSVAGSLVGRSDDYCAINGANPDYFTCCAIMRITSALFVALVSLLLLAHTCRASEEEGHGHDSEHDEDSKPAEANPVWGYSFLFNFLACLPSAFAVIVCLWAKLKVADKVITGLMVFASGVINLSFQFSVGILIVSQ